MSPISPVTGPSSEDALRTEKQIALEKKRPFVDEDSSLTGREPGRPRPVSWHPSTPVEPPLNSTQLRPIGVDSILNPPAKAPSVSASTAETAREGLGDQFSTSPSRQHLPPATVHLPSPSTHAKRLSASPGMGSRQIIAPVSPSARFVSSGVGYPRKASSSQSPLVQETRPGAYTVAPGSPLPVDLATGQPMSVSGYQQPVPVSVHSTPTFHSRRTSANPTPNPSPQETSPTTPVSTFSQFGRSSPAAAPASGPQPASSYLHSTPHTTMEPVSRLPSVVAGNKHASEEPVVLPGSQAENPPYPGMIPCILDLKSGSSSQAEKRKANSDASRRFRNRKRNELQMEQKITAQQDEIRKQTEALQRQAQEIRALMQERDFYRSERDFYREHVSRLVPSGQIPTRPASPRSFQSSDRDHQVWPSTDATQRGVDTSGVPPPASATRSAAPRLNLRPISRDREQHKDQHETEMKGLYEDRPARVESLSRRLSISKRVAIVSAMAVLSVLLPITFLLSSVAGTPVTSPRQQSCNTVDEGYQCFSAVSHLWGQYSPYFSVDDKSSLPEDVPDHCEVTFAQVLSRHGARYPTESKSEKYAKLIKAIQHNATSFSGKYAFLKSYNYSLGADDLTAFGENQLVDSGIKFYQRYEELAKNVVPFIRASGSDRVIASGEKFIEGFQKAKLGKSKTRRDQPAPIVNVVIPETEGFNNTLDHSVCTVFENSKVGDEAEDKFTGVFTPSIVERLEKDLPGTKLSSKEVVYLMDLCSFDTVALTRDGSRISPFCALFTQEEWTQYDYLQSVSKYYGYGAGNPLGPAQGIGFANELIARLTQSPVKDHTSTNTTLDSNPATFPLNATLYADFSHDNTMTSVFFALGLYNKTEPLSQTSVQSTEETNGYSSAWTVPFGARAYVEMMQCQDEKEPLVRVLVNDRVIPLQGCDADKYGRCKRDDFIEGLSFVRSGGNWGECFA